MSNYQQIHWQKGWKTEAENGPVGVVGDVWE